VATAAAWLGRATAAWTSLLALTVGVGGGRTAWLAVPAVLAAAALAVGARRLLAGRGRALVMGASAGGSAVLIVAGSLDGELRTDGTAGVLLWLLWVLSLPVLTVAFAALPRVGGWLSGDIPADPLPYAPPPAFWPAELWPYGAPRPAAATAAAVLAVVAGALTVAAVTGGLLGAAVSGPVDAFTLALVPGLPCAAGLVAGGIMLLRRRSRVQLMVSAVAAVLVLLASAGVAVLASVPDPDGAIVFVGMSLLLPVVTAGLALRRDVGIWLLGHG
jgi:hypothetical protein